MKILLTGFTPFGELSENPSAVILKDIEQAFLNHPSIDLTCVVLKTEFSSAPERMTELINKASFDTVLMLGVATKSKHIRLENRAINYTDKNLKDVCGNCFAGEKIIDDAPDDFISKLPMEVFAKDLREHGFAAELSESAGAFVCNHTYFSVSDYVTKSAQNTKIGFVHIPAFDNMSQELSYKAIHRLIESIFDLHSIPPLNNH